MTQREGKVNRKKEKSGKVSERQGGVRQGGVRQGGGKVPLPGARSTPFGVARRLTCARQRSVSIATYAAHNKRGLRHRRGGPGDVRDVPRSHPQAGGPVLTTLRAPMPVLAFKKSSPSGQRCLFLLQCKAEYKTHVRLESGDESPHSKVAVLPYGAGNCRSIPVPIRLRVLRWGRARRKPVRRRRGRAGIPGDGSPDSRAGKLRRAGR